MNFEFSQEQNLLREQAVGMLRSKCPPNVVRRVLEHDNEPYAKELWSEMANLGWQAATIPEEFGGIGLTHLELCVIAEECLCLRRRDPRQCTHLRIADAARGEQNAVVVSGQASRRAGLQSWG